MQLPLNQSSDMPTRFTPFTLNVKGRVVRFTSPAVMGIVNATPDSFFSGSRTMLRDEIVCRVESMIQEGVDIIDVGACSTRPGAEMVSSDDEIRRLEVALDAIRSVTREVPVSVDTFRSSVAKAAITALGADIVNDISAGTIDCSMIETVAALKVPYVVMHMRATPEVMQSMTHYPQGVTAGVITELSERVHLLKQAGVADIIVDPGFGFAKTVEQNYQLLAHLPELGRILSLPILVGVSRKSMITRPLDIDSNDALEATTALHVEAIARGASLLRVHDVAAARHAIAIHQLVEASCCHNHSHTKNTTIYAI